jgi:ABC-2 type transport system ATP-binding protein
MPNLAIKTEALTKIYKGELGQKPVVGLEDLNLEVKKGEVYAFLGPNGAGKTTTIKLLVRLLHPTKGKIWILDQENTSRMSMEKVGYMPEQPNLYGYLSGREFLIFIAGIFGLNPQSRNQKISDLINRIGLEIQADSPVRTYSRGMVQRLGLAQALINDPLLLILDEPMTSLDPVGRKDFRDLIFELKDQGKTIFFSSHILSDAEMVADRVGILNKGKLISVGKLDDLVSSQINSVEVTFTLDTNRFSKINLDVKDYVIRDKKVMVCLSEEGEVPDFLKRIDNLGGNVVSVVPQRKSLEEFFISELGR